MSLVSKNYSGIKTTDRSELADEFAGIERGAVNNISAKFAASIFVGNPSILIKNTDNDTTIVPNDVNAGIGYYFNIPKTQSFEIFNTSNVPLRIYEVLITNTINCIVSISAESNRIIQPNESSTLTLLVNSISDTVAFSYDVNIQNSDNTDFAFEFNIGGNFEEPQPILSITEVEYDSSLTLSNRGNYDSFNAILTINNIGTKDLHTALPFLNNAINCQVIPNETSETIQPGHSAPMALTVTPSYTEYSFTGKIFSNAVENNPYLFEILGAVAVVVTESIYYPMPPLQDTDKKCYLLAKVEETDLVAKVEFSGTYSVDWGDGIIETGLTGESTHTYVYDEAPIEFSTDGFRGSLIEVTHESGNWTYLSIETGHNILKISGAGQTFTNIYVSSNSLLQEFSFRENSIIDMNSMFAYCTNLVSIPFLDTRNVIYMYYMFFDCDKLTSAHLSDTNNVESMMGMFAHCPLITTTPALDTSNVIFTDYMFYNCSSLTSVNLLDTGNVEDMEGMFAYCSSLTSIPLLNTIKVRNMKGMFASCSSLISVPLLDASSVTDFTSTFYNCPNLTVGALSGTKSDISYENCNLDATNLDLTYTNLAIVTGKTIKITGNRGVDTDNPTIATDKGWIVELLLPHINVVGVADNSSDNHGNSDLGDYIDITYTVENTGGAPLTINSLTLDGETNCSVTITENLDSTIQGHDNDTYTLRVQPTAIGFWNFQNTIESNDPDNTSYHFSVGGVMQGAGEIFVDGYPDEVFVDDGDMYYEPYEVTYIVENIGGSTIDIDHVTPINSSDIGVDIIQDLPATIAGFGSAPLTVRITPLHIHGVEYWYGLAIASGPYGTDEYTVQVEATTTDTALDILEMSNYDTLADIPLGEHLDVVYTAKNVGSPTIDINQPTFVDLVNCTVTVEEGIKTPLIRDEQDTFTIRVTPTASGAISFDMRIETHTPDTVNNYAISGDCIVLIPEINVVGIVDGGSDDLGSTGATINKIYTVENTGDSDLITSTPTFTNLVNCSVVITEGLDSTITSGNSDTFEIEITPTVLGAYSFDISIVNNDTDENPYNWEVGGSYIETLNEVMDYPMPTLLDTDKKCYLLAKVETTDLVATVNFSGTYSVDWGDGNTETGLTGESTHTYVYDEAPLFFTTENYKGSLIKVTNESGNWTEFTCQDGDNILKISGAGQTITTFDVNLNTQLLEFSFRENNITSAYSIFDGCISLISIPLLDTSSVSFMVHMFKDCYSLTSIPLLTIKSSVSTMQGMFKNCSSLTTIPLLDTSSVGGMVDMFEGCSSLTSIPLLDTSSVTDMGNMFAYCPNLEVGAMSGTEVDISYEDCNLDATNLNLIYTNLATATQTITVTGNPGVGADNPTIATNKNWTVIGS